MPDMRAAPAVTVTVSGRFAEVLVYLGEYLESMEERAVELGTPPPTQWTNSRDRLQHLQGLVRNVGAGLPATDGIPSPHYLRSLAAQAMFWLVELRDRGEVSW